ncbi:MAG: hypothetical protein WB661_12060 [Candidatus Bathyarchaeia archaeon]
MIDIRTHHKHFYCEFGTTNSGTYAFGWVLLTGDYQRVDEGNVLRCATVMTRFDKHQ